MPAFPVVVYPENPLFALNPLLALARQICVIHILSDRPIFPVDPASVLKDCLSKHAPAKPCIHSRLNRQDWKRLNAHLRNYLTGIKMAQNRAGLSRP